MNISFCRFYLKFDFTSQSLGSLGPAWLGLYCMRAKWLQSCLTHCEPTDCSPPGSSVHVILQARLLEWVAMPSSRRSSNPAIEPTSPVSPALQDSLPGKTWANTPVMVFCVPHWWSVHFPLLPSHLLKVTPLNFNEHFSGAHHL